MERMKRRAAALVAAVMLLTALPMLAAAEEAPLYIENQWNYVDVSMDVSGGIPEDATGRLARIRMSGRLTVATEPYFPPQEFIDESREGQARFVGADMELARLIAERMGVELEIVPLDFTDVLTDVAEGKYDLAVSALSFTSSRAAVLEMSKGYYFTSEQSGCGLLIRADDAELIQSIDDLAERDIAAQSGSLQETMAAESIVFYRKFRRMATIDEVYQALTAGEIDAGVVDIENARVYIAGHPDCGFAVVPGVRFKLQPQYEGDRVAAEKGEIELIAFVNGVIDEVLESGQYEAWFDEYAGYDNANQ